MIKVFRHQRPSDELRKAEFTDEKLRLNKSILKCVGFTTRAAHELSENLNNSGALIGGNKSIYKKNKNLC